MFHLYTVYTIEIQLYFNIHRIKVYSYIIELIFDIKCSCLDVQILREKVEFWGGVIIFGQTTRGGPQKLNPCSWGGVKKMIYRGLPKKKSPLQKWLTWFTMTMNKENVNKSYVFVLTWVPVCKYKQ